MDGRERPPSRRRVEPVRAPQGVLGGSAGPTRRTHPRTPPSVAADALTARALANADAARAAPPRSAADEPARLQTVSMEAAVATVRALLPVAAVWSEADPV